MKGYDPSSTKIYFSEKRKVYSFEVLDYDVHIVRLPDSGSNKHGQKSMTWNNGKNMRSEFRHACLISENFAIKSSGMDQSNMSKFCMILAVLELFGSTLCPI
jgi:hypothetical protein